jgi:hypothetical protein
MTLRRHHGCHAMPIFVVWQPLCNSSPGQQAVWSQYFGRATPRSQASSNALSVGPYTKNPSTQVREDKVQAKRKDRNLLYARLPPICTRWNKSQCRAPDCSYRQICLECHGQHWEPECLPYTAREVGASVTGTSRSEV